MFLSFGNLSSEIKLDIIRKFEPIPYVRFRRGSRWAETFCEQHRNYIGIHPREFPTLFLLNSKRELNPFAVYFEDPEAEDLDGVFVITNYGRMQWDSTLSIEMTKENISRLRAAISGFYFVEVVFWNLRVSEDHQEIYGQAFDNFMKAAFDLDPLWFTGKNMTDERIDRVATIWKPKRIEWANSHEDNRWSHALTKNSSSILGTIRYASNRPVVDLHQLVKGKTSINLDALYYPKEILWDYIQKIVQDQKCGKGKLSRIQLGFEEVREFQEVDLTKEGFFHQLRDSFHLGTFDLRCVERIRMGEDGRMTRKFDYWLWSLNDLDGKKRLGLIKVTRTAGMLYSWVSLLVKEALNDGKFDTEGIAGILGEIFEHAALDLSGFCQELEGKSMEQMKELLEEKKNKLIIHYRRLNRRSIFNVLHEVVTQLWNGPQFILELKQKEYNSKEQRNRFSDVIVVLYQEVLCPIYQFCSF